MNPAPDPRRDELRALAAEGDETAAHDLFPEYGETVPADHANDFPPPRGDAGEENQKNASDPEGD